MGDMEYRLRHRYLDMIYTPDTLRRAHQRVKIIRTIRNHLDALGYMEVETPTLHAIAGGAAARPFETHHNALDIDLYPPHRAGTAAEAAPRRRHREGLRDSAACSATRGSARRHNPEFTMLELYQAYGDYRRHDGPDRGADRRVRRSSLGRASRVRFDRTAKDA